MLGFEFTDIFHEIDPEDEIKNEVSIMDKDWISSRFMVPDSDVVLHGEQAGGARYTSTASYKFTSTSMGANIGMNAKPQYCRYADIRPKQRMSRNPVSLASTSGNHGMGRYYSEAIDDNAETIFMEFGVPTFNGLLSFFTSAIDYEESIIANTGRSTLAYNLGQMIGGLVAFAAFPAISMAVWAIKGTTKLLFAKNRFDYYHMTPRMTNYWGTVSTLVTQLVTEQGLLNPIMMPDSADDKIGQPMKFDNDDVAQINRMIPGLIDEKTHYVDVYLIATRAQKLANMQSITDREEYLTNLNKEYTDSDMGVFEYLKSRTFGGGGDAGGGWGSFSNSVLMAGNLTGLASNWDVGTKFQDHINTAKEFHDMRIDPAENKKIAEAKKAAERAFKEEEALRLKSGMLPQREKYTKDDEGMYKNDMNPEEAGILGKYTNAINSAMRDGGGHAVFYVDYSGSVSESFSNSTSKIETSDSAKQVGMKARNLKFNTAGGNFVDGMDAMLQAGKDVVSGMLDQVTAGLGSVLQALTGGGFVDLPLKWDDSTMSLPSITYTMKLISPYGNLYSQLQNIYIPLCMLMAGALPLASGKSSYTSPYLCNLFNKGKQQIELGMITSLSITRGTSNLGWTKTRKPLAIDVSFTVTDFSTIMTAPVNGSIFNIFSPAVDDYSTLGRYIAVMGSRDLASTKYAVARAKIRISKAAKNMSQFFNVTRVGMITGENLSGVLGGFTQGNSLSLQYYN